VPLSLTAYQRVVHARENQTATLEVEKWLEGTSYHLDMVNVNDRVVTVTVEGSGERKPLQRLANQLALTLDRPVLVTMRTLPAQTTESSSP
jgi:hypothetical protein